MRFSEFSKKNNERLNEWLPAIAAVGRIASLAARPVAGFVGKHLGKKIGSKLGKTGAGKVARAGAKGLAYGLAGGGYDDDEEQPEEPKSYKPKKCPKGKIWDSETNRCKRIKSDYGVAGEDAAGVGTITKQNATKDVKIGDEYANVKKLGLSKKKKR